MKTGSWGVTFDLTLDGVSVRWDDLSETSQCEILRNIAVGYFSGELYEDEDEDEND